jgi:LacI family transcriptional regulator, galactose operon repressor
MMRATIHDVAKNAGVSVATVSHVINGTHYVSPELADRVYESINKLNYQQNKLARALSRKNIPLLALIVPDISNPYWSSLARAVQDVTDPYDYSVIVCSSDGILEREIRFLRSLSGWVSGLILHPYHVSQVQVNQLILHNPPVVILGEFTISEKQPPNWDQVAANNRESVMAAVEYLISLGHRRIAFIQGTAGTPSSVKRMTGFLDALNSAGLPVDDNLIIPGDYTRVGGRKAMAELLNRPDPPTAVVGANDLSALGALEEAQLRGHKVPQSISIVGFDDIDEAALASPPLTTIRLPPHEIGVVAAEKLIERLKGREESSYTFIKGELIVRESTAGLLEPSAS